MLSSPLLRVGRMQVAMLVLELRQKGVCSLPALAQQWCRDPTYLQSAVQTWIKVGSRQDFNKAWLNAIRSAVAALSAAAATAAAAKAAVSTSAAGAGIAAGGGAATAKAGKKAGKSDPPRKRKREKEEA